MPARRREPEHPACPRCGYDQRGVVSTWTQACPVRGTCAECGLEFEWSRVLNRARYEPQWCIEFSPGKSPVRILQSFCTTAWRSFHPWTFWQSISMEHRIRWRRLVMYVAILILPFVLLYVAAQSWAALQVRASYISRFAEIFNVQIAADSQQVATLKSNLELWGQPESRYADRVNNAIAALEISMAQNRKLAANPLVPTPLQVTWEHVISPLKQRSSLQMTYPSGLRQPYVAPVDIWDSVIDARFIPTAAAWQPSYWWNMQYRAKRGALWFITACTYVLLFPLTLLVLPATLRRRKVRLAHVGRVVMYSVLMVPVLFVIVALCVGVFTTASRVSPVICRIAIGSTLVMLLVYYGFALSRYMKLPRAWFVTAMLSWMSLLLPIALVWIMSENTAIQILQGF
ncbi:MAG: hypothetical protein ACR2GY_14240 [Phycisphaerales bacterium]